mmetsp:Transcript_148482/g.475266  ORF Transcript_148482/g.475266 Transcript_148482/m.475266 type:complete len:179 (+) Transcript_148482:529-1065(+)
MDEEVLFLWRRRRPRVRQCWEPQLQQHLRQQQCRRQRRQQLRTSMWHPLRKRHGRAANRKRKRKQGGRRHIKQGESVVRQCASASHCSIRGDGRALSPAFITNPNSATCCNSTALDVGLKTMCETECFGTRSLEAECDQDNMGSGRLKIGATMSRGVQAKTDPRRGFEGSESVGRVPN